MNSFYYELIERGETDVAANYLRYLNGELDTNNKRYLVSHFRITDLRRKIITIVRQARKPIKLIKVIRKIEGSKPKTIEADLELLVAYGYLDEADGRYTTTHLGDAIDPVPLDERICEAVKNLGEFTIPDVFERVKVDSASMLRPAIRKLLKCKRLTKTARGRFVACN